jgi:hypothetical protein
MQHLATAGGVAAAAGNAVKNAVMSAIVGAVVGVVAGSGLALAQSAPPDAGPFSIETLGVFRDLMQKGDFAPKGTLADAMARRPTTGVGAVSGARGEVTIWDGRLIVSYGKPEASAPSGGDTAALLATGKATAWHRIEIGFDVEPDKVGAFLVNRARAHGIDPDKSFPFQITGVVAPFVMHVNAAPTGGPYGMGRPMAITAERKGAEIAGHVAGIYAGPALVGVITHHGERVHAHWVSTSGSDTAHLDRWGIKTGSVLMLPKAQ